MIIPIYYLLIPYGVLVLAAGIFVLFNVMHLLAFGMESFKTAFLVLLYIGSTAAVVGFSYFLIMQFDWTQELMVSDIISSIINPII